MNTTTDKFMQETLLTADNCMKGVPNTHLNYNQTAAELTASVAMEDCYQKAWIKPMQEGLEAGSLMPRAPFDSAPPAPIDLKAFDNAIKAANLTYLAEIEGNREILIKLFQTYEDFKNEKQYDLKAENEKYEELLQKYMKENAYLKLHGCLGTMTSAPAFIPPDEDNATKG